MGISLIEFSVENYKIFKDKVTFSMIARQSKHTFKCNSENLLKTSLIYGPNATGKTTLLEAFENFQNLILTSARNDKNSSHKNHWLIECFQPFILGENEKKPIFFEIVFAIDKESESNNKTDKNKRIFRYNILIDNNKILKENLYEITKSTKKLFFKRIEQKIEVYFDFKESEDVINKTRPDFLFLSVASMWNNSFAINIVSRLSDINIIFTNNLLFSKNIKYSNYNTTKQFKEEHKRKKIIEYLQKADFSIIGGGVNEKEIPDPFRKDFAKLLPNISKIDSVFLKHYKYNSQGEKISEVEMDLRDESVGTQQFFSILGPIIEFLENSNVLVIDEFDNSIHPYITKLIIDLFEKENPKNAQLIVTTHDTSLLSHKNLNKEHFWFTEKDKFGAGKLFSLNEFKLRNDEEYSKKYLEGRFGAVPFIDFELD